MPETDQRPPYGEMPAHLMPVHDRYAPLVTQFAMDAFEAVMAQPTDRPRAELINDALSMQSQLAAYAGVVLVEQMVREKSVPFEMAFQVAMADLLNRVRFSFELLAAARAAKDAVKQ